MKVHALVSIHHKTMVMPIRVILLVKRHPTDGMPPLLLLLPLDIIHRIAPMVIINHGFDQGSWLMSSIENIVNTAITMLSLILPLLPIAKMNHLNLNMPKDREAKSVTLVTNQIQYVPHFSPLLPTMVKK